MKLPDCEGRDEPLALLSGAEKRELLMRMAEEGPEAVQNWLKERAASDARWETFLERMRGDVEREVDEYRRKMKRNLEEDEERIRRRRRASEEDIEQRVQRAQRRLAETRAEQAEVLERALSKADLARRAEEAGEPDSAWARFVAWLYQVWLSITRWFRRVLGRGADEVQRIRLAAPDGSLRELDVGFALAQSKEFRQAVRGRLKDASWRERLRRFRDRLLQRRDYEEIVADLVREEVEQAKEQEEEQIEERAREVEDEVGDLEEDLEETRREAREAMAEVERRRREAEEEIARRLEEEPLEQAAGEIRSELARTGLVDESGPTRRLLDRMSELLFEAELRGLAGTEPKALAKPQGAEMELEKHPLVTLDERSRVALVDSLVKARTRHPDVRHLTDQDLMVYRNTERPRAHVVLICDTSASMEEHDRMGAAKRATFALHGAVARHSPDHVINVVLMDTEVRRASLREVWDTDPKGFTNTGGALLLTRRLLEAQPADTHLVILVTDGLPEAVMEGGDAVAAHPGEATAYAVKQAKRLSRVPDLDFTCVLLEPDDELFVEAAEDVADELDGHVVATDPEDLAGHLLVEFSEGVVEKEAEAGARAASTRAGQERF